MNEPQNSRLKRLKIRSWRRGMREVDLLIGPFADDRLATMDGVVLAEFEALLDENDQDLLAWLTGTANAPVRYEKLVKAIIENNSVRLGK